MTGRCCREFAAGELEKVTSSGDATKSYMAAVARAAKLREGEHHPECQLRDDQPDNCHPDCQSPPCETCGGSGEWRPTPAHPICGCPKCQGTGRASPASAGKEGGERGLLIELTDAAQSLYMAGRWSCPDLSDKRQAELWERLRDAARMAKGSATVAGVADHPRPAPGLREAAEEAANLLEGALQCSDGNRDLECVDRETAASVAAAIRQALGGEA